MFSFSAKKLCLDSNLEERFEYSFNLVKDECSISFIQKKDGQEVALLNLVDKGRQQMANLFFCDGLKYVEPCMIYMTSAITSCSGRFEVKDSNGNLAYSLELSIVCEYLLCSFIFVFWSFHGEKCNFMTHRKWSHFSSI